MNTLLINLNGLLGEGLKTLITHHYDASVFGGANGLDQVREKVYTDEYDLAIFDLDSVQPNVALDMIKALAIERSRTPFVVLSNSDSSELADLILEYGAGACVPKSRSSAVLMNAIQKLLPAKFFKLNQSSSCGCGSEDLPESLSNAATITADALTPRQLDVLRELYKGKSNKHIACDLSVSENTVRNHLSAVFRVLRARNRTEAICHATSLRIIPDPYKQSELVSG